MASYYPDGKTWTVSWRPKGQRRLYIYGIKSERIARQTADAKTLQEQLVKAGLVKYDAAAEKIQKADAQPIGEHIDEFEKSIVARGKQKRQGQQQSQHVRRLCSIAGIRHLSELNADKLQAAAKSLMDEQNLSPRTANSAIKAMRQFSTWAFSVAGSLAYDVLHRKLAIYNEEVDQRRRRRALSIEEYEQLIAWTLAPGKDPNNRCGIPKIDRAMLYQVAIGTGFRREALLGLTKASFHVGAKNQRPTIVMPAKLNKSGVDKVQGIRRDLADALRDWLKTKPEEGSVWRLNKHAELAGRFKRDLGYARDAWIQAARDPAEKQKRYESTFLLYSYDDGRGMVFCDFHGLRHTGITYVVREAGLKAGQAWAGHSTPVLTARYAHMDLTDEQRCLEALPGARPARQPAQLAESQAKNGNKRQSRKIG